jgi:N-formylglutamate amidohydrolase
VDEFSLVARATVAEGPLVATAVHDGHAVRPQVAELLALDEAQRLREEDPFTGEWTSMAPTRVVGLRSRFEVDFNRPRDRAVYLTPEQAWGLTVWRWTPPDDLVRQSLAEYDAFYAGMGRLLDEKARSHGKFVVFDLHTYNHRRDGPDAPPADPRENPEINLGTGTMPRQRWAPLVDRFMADLRAGDPQERRPLDVRENVRFRGGYFSQWVHETYPDTGCALAIEVKKFFMDEWTGSPDRRLIASIARALSATVPGVLDELSRL